MSLEYLAHSAFRHFQLQIIWIYLMAALSKVTGTTGPSHVRVGFYYSFEDVIYAQKRIIAYMGILDTARIC